MENVRRNSETRNPAVAQPNTAADPGFDEGLSGIFETQAEIEPHDPCVLIVPRSLHDQPDDFRPMTKQWATHETENGLLTKRSFAKAKEFDFTEGFRTPNVRALHGVLAELDRRDDSSQLCVIRGAPGDPRGLRRMAKRLEGGHIEACARTWVMLDLDKGLTLPPEVDIRTEAGLRSAGELARSRLPEAFREVACVVQASASCGIHFEDFGGETTYVSDGSGPWPVKVHLWFVCSRPVSDAEWRTWINTWTLMPDTSVFNPVQVHYITKPSFEGIDDPMQVRIVLLEGERDVVQVPEIVLPSKVTRPVNDRPLTTLAERKWATQFDWAAGGLMGAPEPGDRFDCPACGGTDGAEVLPDSKLLCRAQGHKDRAPDIGGVTDNGGYVMGQFEAFERVPRSEVTARLRELNLYPRVGRAKRSEVRTDSRDTEGGDADADSDEAEPHPAEPFQIHVTDRRNELCDQTLDALATHPDVYSRGGKLVRVAKLDGRLSAILIKPQALVDVASQVARFYVPVKEGHKPRPLTRDEAESILERREHGQVRALRGIVHTPTLLPDGRLISDPGYDTASGLLYAPLKRWPDLRKEPTADDADAAMRRLAELFSEFEFVQPEKASPSHAISTCIGAMLTMQARQLYDGAAPLFLFDASAPGAGKGLASRVVTRIGAGHEVSAETQRDNAETEKRITASLLAGRDVILIDNIQKPLGGAALCSAITESTLSSRRLGKSEGLELPNKLTFLATGNNVVLGEDMHRRTLVVRNVPKTADPHLRTFSKDLDAYTREHQIELTTDVITILRAFLLAKPQVELRPFGGFSAWSKIVCGALVWLGQSDLSPVSGVAPLDFRTEQLTVLAGAWRALYGTAELSTTDVLNDDFKAASSRAEGTTSRAIYRSELRSCLRALAGVQGEVKLEPQHVGNVLGAARDRVLQIDDNKSQGSFMHRQSNNKRLWRWQPTQ